MTKTGNPYLRYYLIQAAQCLVNHNPEYREYFTRKFNETPRHPHKRALSLTARKLVRLVFALLSKNQLYFAKERQHAKDREVNSASVPEVQAEVLGVSENGSKKVKTQRLPHAQELCLRAGTCEVAEQVNT